MREVAIDIFLSERVDKSTSELLGDCESQKSSIDEPRGVQGTKHV